MKCKIINNDRINLEGRVLSLPCGPPLTLGIVERVGSVGISVCPGLSTLTIREVRIGSTDSEVKNEVELAIKWSRIILSNPGVISGRRETTSLPEAFLGKINLKDLVGVSIKEGVKSVIVPVETIYMELVGES
jgi:hypothetical protein